MTNATNNIGVIELASIYKGFEVQDAILKNEHVEKLIARTICSGKYLIIVRGEIADVESCLERAREIGGFAIVSALIITSVNDAVFQAIAGNTVLESAHVEAAAIIETFSVAAAIKAADIAIEEADIDILRIHVAMAIGGKGLVVLTGNIEALKSALIPAIDYIKDEGMLGGYSLISQPHDDVLRELL
ncbi:BMC domain-containing protein [candidate division KSB1 bacterium]|nr:BMC domain-containing protein [candidate division KSB1 bacterium]